MKTEKRTSKLWIRNTSRYTTEEVWPLLKLAYESAKRAMKPGKEAPRIILQLTNSESPYCGRASWTEYHYPPGYNPKTNPGWNKETRMWNGQEKWKRILCRIGAPYHFPMLAVYPRFKEMPEYRLESAREALCYIIAHEMEHAFGADGSKDGEIRCELAGQDAVDLYRRRRAEIDEEINGEIAESLFLSLKRRETARARAKAEKLENTRALLKKWESKSKAAINKVKKYRAALRRLEKANVLELNQGNNPEALAARGKA